MSNSVLYLARHATPDWFVKNIPYDTPPGPPLVPQGEQEAAQLAAWLANRGIHRLEASPMLRARQTADIVGQHLQLPVVMAADVTEWRRGEPTADLQARMQRYYANWLAADWGPSVVITHGGPIDYFLKSLGVPETVLAPLRPQFDHGNPVPCAGVWQVSPAGCDLVFVPTVPVSV